MDALIVGSREALWGALQPAFARHDINPTLVAGMEQALGRIRTAPPALVILDHTSGLEAEAHLDAVREALVAVLTANALVNTAVVTTMDGEEFHEATEGFGVLGSLPATPGEQDIDTLAAALRAVTG